MSETPPRLLTLEIGAEMIGLKPADLRSAIRKGALTHARIGRRYYVTQSDLTEFVQACRVTLKDHGSGSGHGPADPANGSSSTTAASIAQAAALGTALALSRRSPATSKPSTGPRQKAGT